MDTESDGLSGDPSQPDCGFDIVEVPPGPLEDPCLVGDVVAGPESYTRVAGSPVTSLLPFELDEEASVCVHVVNGGDTRATRIASATVRINGDDLLGPGVFNPGVEAVQARSALGAGEHEVSTRLASTPGTFLSVEVRAVAGTDSPHRPIIGDEEHIRIFDLKASPDIFSPNDNGIRDTTELSVVTDFIPPVPGNGGMSTYELQARFEIASADSCGSTVDLVTTVALDAPITTELSVTWDGKDSEGDTVADGTYFYRVTVEALRIVPGGGSVPLDSATSQIQSLIVTSDDEPPALDIERPAGGIGATTDGSFLVVGDAADASGIAQVVLSDGETDVVLALDVDGRFTHDAPLLSLTPDDLLRTTNLTVTATDNFDNETTEPVRIDRMADHVPGQLVLFARPGAPVVDVAGLAVGEGGVVRRYNRLFNSYLVDFGSEADASAAKPTLEASSLLNRVEENALAFAELNPRDPWFDGPGSLNHESYTFVDLPEAWDVTIGSRSVTVGIMDSGIDHRHPELQNNLFVNSGELPTSDEFPVTERIVDADGDGVITFIDLNHPDNLGKVPGAPATVVSTDLIDGDVETDIGLEGDLNGDTCPGRCDVDDDFDGLADLEDRDVALADYNGNGRPTCGFNARCFDPAACSLNVLNCDDEEDREMWAQKDDDENGIADDILGADFACKPGEDILLNDEGRPRACQTNSPDNDPMDFTNHGTFVAGVIGALEHNVGPIFGDVSVVGVNWEVRMVMGRVGVIDSSAFDGAAMDDAFAYFADLARRPTTNIRAVNLSGGATLDDPPRPPRESDPRAEVLDTAGVLLVASAGNDGLNLDDLGISHSPSSAENENIISVAAGGDSGLLAGFSNRGITQVDLVAPGDNGFLDPYVISTVRTNDCQAVWFAGFLAVTRLCKDGYGKMDGTSFAAPHVAGTIALMQTVHPTGSHLVLRELLLDNVKTISAGMPPTPVDLAVVTKGHLDSDAAVQAALAAGAVVPPPTEAEVGADNLAAISEDGSVIAFVSTRVTSDNPFGMPRIWIVASDGTGLTPVPAPVGASEIEPALSSDGSRLVFASTRDGSDFEIYVADIDPADFSVSITQRTFNSVDDRYPDVSADGEWIAFASTFEITPDTLGDFEIFRITSNDDPDEGFVLEQTDVFGRAQVTKDSSDDFAAPELADDRRPSINADGTVVAWVNAIGKTMATAGDEDVFGVAEFNGVPTVSFFSPPGLADVKKTALTVAGTPDRVFFGTAADASTADGGFHSIALDGTDHQHLETETVTGGGVSGDGAFVVGFEPTFLFGTGGGILRVDAATEDTLVLAQEPDGEPSAIVGSCGIVRQVELVTSFDHVSPPCQIAVSGDGSVVAFSATFSAFVDLPTPPPQDLFIFREGVGTIRVTPN